VKRSSALRLLFAALAIVGLILTPITVSTMAKSVGASDQASMAMPADMPCCPDEVPMPGCGKDCPFMAICAAQMLSIIPEGSGLPARLALASIVVPADDAGLSGLTQRPPPRPPKI
jgi:hypothetical protein